VAFDTSKIKHAISIAESGRGGEVRFLGDLASAGRAPDPKARENELPMIMKLARGSPRSISQP
jgi:hypothetical protein